MTDKEREQDKQLVANLERETSEQANEIERLHNVLRKSRHYVRAVFELAQEFANQPYILHEIDAALEQPSAEPVRVFAQAILHGDDEHKAWLIEAAEAFIAGNPLPVPRGKGTKQSDAGILHNKEAGFKEVVTQDTATIYDNYPQLRFVEEILDFDRKLIGFRVYDASAQSDAEPVAGGLAKARTIALEQRCERGTPWDLACVTIANKIGEQYGCPPIPTGDISGTSWSGFYVYGDKKSIDAVRDALHAKDRCDALDKLIGEKQLVRPDTSAGLIEAANVIEGLLSEWDKFAKYGSPMAKLANERVTFAREILSRLRARAADRSGK